MTQIQNAYRRKNVQKVIRADPSIDALVKSGDNLHLIAWIRE